MQRTFLSIVIPVFNEKESLLKLYAELKMALKGITNSHEIIFVDDGSSDGSNEILRSLSRKDKKTKVVTLRSNFGKTAALSHGFRVSSGDIIITMDADLQDNPADIPKFMKKINDFDVVCGWRRFRMDSPRKKIVSFIYNRITRFIIGVNVHDMNCGFKTYRSGAVKNIKLYGEMHRYIPVLLNEKKYRIGEVEVDHRKRLHGKSKYGTMRIIKGMLDLIIIKFLVSYSKKPFYLFGIFGIFLLSIGTIVNIGLLLTWLGGEGIGDRPLLILGVLLMVMGLQSVSMGLIGEMIYQKKNDEFVSEVL